MGIIDSLSAGYRLLGRKIEVLVVPIFLDLVLWWAPRLSIAPLIERLAEFYRSAATMEEMPQDMADMSRQVSQLLVETGQSSNLLDSLVSTSLLHVPSLLATVGTVSSGEREIANPITALLLFGAFGLAGILFGVIYMNMLASRVPLGTGSKQMTPQVAIRTVIRHWLMVVLYIVMIALFLAAASIPFLLGTAVLSLISPALGSIFVVLLSGAVLVLFFYMYFVTASLVMDNLPLHTAIGRSFVLVRSNFWSTLGFIILTNIIAAGIALIIRHLTSLTPVGTLAAIVINAYIGSGLALALLVFYRTHILRQADEKDGTDL